MLGDRWSVHLTTHKDGRQYGRHRYGYSFGTPQDKRIGSWLDDPIVGGVSLQASAAYLLMRRPAASMPRPTANRPRPSADVTSGCTRSETLVTPAYRQVGLEWCHDAYCQRSLSQRLETGGQSSRAQQGGPAKIEVDGPLFLPRREWPPHVSSL